MKIHGFRGFSRGQISNQAYGIWLCTERYPCLLAVYSLKNWKLNSLFVPCQDET